MLDDSQKQAIQQAYRQFLESKQLKARWGQRLMVAQVARTIGSIERDCDGLRVGNDGAHICAVEAGTGTGKTVAYSLAAIPLAQMLEKKLVIATATVALQEQIVLKDLPDIHRHSGLRFSYGLVKGRGRYACIYKLDRQLAMTEGETIPLYPDEEMEQLPGPTIALYQQLLDALGSNRWDGDRDNWPDSLADSDWQRLTTDHGQCTGRHCAYVSQCPFFKSRDGIKELDVVVANHDLVLADLALGGGAILSKPEDTIYIFDEGHHLPEKALDHFAAHTRLRGAERLLQQANKQVALIGKNLPDAAALLAQLARWGEHEAYLSEAIAEANPAFEQFFMDYADPAAGKQERQYRFTGGVLPEWMQSLSQNLSKAWNNVYNVLNNAKEELAEMLENREANNRDAVEQAFIALGGLVSRIDHTIRLWQLFARKDPDNVPPTARWIDLIDTGLSHDLALSASPVSPVDVLREHLWWRCFGAVVTSATLRSLGSFDRLRYQAGLPANAECVDVPSPFDYQANAVFCVPQDAVEGNLQEPHTQYIIKFLHESVDLAEATLVLFSSRRQMLDVYQALLSPLLEAVLLQDDYSKQQLLNLHRARVDAGEPSVIFGLASFAEGVDLPRDYLKHVVIAKIPFMPPDEPVSQTLSEWIEARGGNAFMQISVADASFKLVQAAGRLLRTEQDSGRISLLDKRFKTKRYGKSLQQGLPPYRFEL